MRNGLVSPTMIDFDALQFEGRLGLEGVWSEIMGKVTGAVKKRKAGIEERAARKAEEREARQAAKAQQASLAPSGSNLLLIGGIALAVLAVGGGGFGRLGRPARRRSRSRRRR